jgi:isopentenyl-diphosphate delta-isomerase
VTDTGGGQTSARKDDHLRIALEEDVSFEAVTTGLERLRFVHRALPELNLEDVDPSTEFLGHRLSCPLMVASMTGGTAASGRLNRILAELAQEFGIPMGLGSTRVLLEEPAAIETFQVRSYAPDIPLFANLGAVQLNYGYGVDACSKLVNVLDADGLYLHLNPLQEALQPEGDTKFAGLLTRIEDLCRELAVPVIVKEVGWGLSGTVAKQLIDAGVSALDVAGAGGTSWSQVERHRSRRPEDIEVAASFRDWGIPTAESIRQVRAVSGSIPLVGSGGIRTGIDAAKCLALGADVASFAGVMLEAAAISAEALRTRISVIRRQLLIAMFLTGSPRVPNLRQAEMVCL